MVNFTLTSYKIISNLSKYQSHTQWCLIIDLSARELRVNNSYKAQIQFIVIAIIVSWQYYYFTLYFKDYHSTIAAAQIQFIVIPIIVFWLGNI